MGYYDEDGQWKPFGMSPVSDVYWGICECELCVGDREAIIAFATAEQLLRQEDQMLRDVLSSSAIPTQFQITEIDPDEELSLSDLDL